MSLAELWQVYDAAGQQVVGRGETPEGFDKDPSLYMANSHVWVWRDSNGVREILLQRRAFHLPRRPGYLHASASGHVNLGERPELAAIREVNEEIGLNLARENLRVAFTEQGGPRGESYNHVFVCEADSFEELQPNRREVDSLRWVTLSSFDEMRRAPGEHLLIDLGQDYFDKLIAVLETT